MGRYLMLYASTTGNTELMAEAMISFLKDRGQEVIVKTFDFDPISVEEILDYHAVLIGTYTWDDGSLPYEVEDFYEELEDVDIRSQTFAVFGSGDTFYEFFGGAVDLFYERIHELGGRLLPFKLKVDLEPKDEDVRRCEDFVDKLLQFCSNE
ncbi:flavodoxin domain-containing protein [Virgibacillus soli]|uniref:Flavodoxin domain-containing protein n=1 Tax=Paracerasibacillus soli TaxID=480284 RepID=A0ABU5CT05_9BACI|nr:flavodoxin domain-containing protein [Virgibacillus soli]MDY0408972.1 flavodoxin domain-containing protein [Virgibacillus soli]